MRAILILAATSAGLLFNPADVALAQQPAQQPAQQQGAKPAAQPGAQPGATWDTMPRMQLERIYAGPLRDTIVQRWRDPADGTVCYLYLPVTAQHSQPTQQGFVQYGPNTIGSISCIAGIDAARSAAEPPARPAPRR